MSSSMKPRARPGRVSAKLIFSYVLDWVVIILTAVVGAVFSIITPNKRPFSLVDPDISFPYVVKEKISTSTLVLCGLVAPGVIIFIVSMIFVPGPIVSKSTPKSLIWRRKLWEWHQGWLGLGLSLASAFLITDGMKNLFGRPRPDLLSRCNPDLANASKYAIGEVKNLVTAAICQNTDKSIMNDGFRSFPSGHSSFSSAGLNYLSLFLASKLSLTIPYLPHSPSNPNTPASSPSLLRAHSASPPLYLLIPTIIPFLSSIYIVSTRFSDFRHHAFDILFGYFLGTSCALFAFRYYHLPLSRGAGWAWGPRSAARAFWAGVGVGTYVGDEHATAADQDGGADYLLRELTTNNEGPANHGFMTSSDVEAAAATASASARGIMPGY